MNRYDDETGEVTLSGRATLYTLAHERAHQLQSRMQTGTWRIHARLVNVPWLRTLSRLGVEIEAAMVARRALVSLGLWRPQHRREMMAGLVSYLRPW